MGGRPTTTETRFLSYEYAASQCERRKEFALWHNEKMIYPNATTAPLPEKDMPDEIKKDFDEARQVFPLSSRSSAALLRLVIQKLSKHLGYSGKDMNDDIGKMVAKGLGSSIQQAFDAVRVIGNESVHPGGKLGAMWTDSELKRGKSARIMGISASSSSHTAPDAASFMGML